VGLAWACTKSSTIATFGAIGVYGQCPLGVIGLHQFRIRALALVLAIATTNVGCSHFIVRPDDGAGTEILKGTVRIIAGVATIGGSEVYVQAAKFDEQIATTFDHEEAEQLQKERDNMVLGYWTIITFVLIVGVIVAAAAASSGSGSGNNCTIHTPSGTCSWHRGVSHCNNGVAICNDGQVSPGMQPCTVTCP
jgi:hypothetical protein